MAFQHHFILITALFCFLAFPVYAQETPPATATTTAAGTAPGPEYDLRLELAQQLHQYQPISLRVIEALEVTTNDMLLNDEEQQRFIADVMGDIDMVRLEQVAVENMARIFTADELQVMINYYSQPEAESIEEKRPVYRQAVDSVMTREVSNALTALQLEQGNMPPEIAPPAAQTPPIPNPDAVPVPVPEQ